MSSKTRVGRPTSLPAQHRSGVRSTEGRVESFGPGRVTVLPSQALPTRRRRSENHAASREPRPTGRRTARQRVVPYDTEILSVWVTTTEPEVAVMVTEIGLDNAEVGIPEMVAVPLPLSVKLKPSAGSPIAVRTVPLGAPAVVTENVPA